MKSITLNDFSGGLNQSMAPHLIADNQFPDALNIRIDNHIPESRQGSQSVNTASLLSTITWDYTTKLNGTNFTLAGTEDGRLLRLSGNTFVEVENGLNSQIEGITWLDKMYYVDSGPGIGEWDGTNAPIDVVAYTPSTEWVNKYGMNIISQITSPSHIVVYKGRIVVAQGSEIFVSQLDIPGYFPESQKYGINEGDGDIITKLIIYRGDLIIFKSRSIYVLRGSQPIMTDPDPYMLDVVHDKVGCVASKSAYLCDNNLIFVSKKGVYMLVNAVTKDDRNVEPIQFNIQPIFDSIIPENSVAIDYKGWYRLAVDNRVLLFDYNNNRWLLDSYPVNFNSFRVDTEGRLLGGADDGFLYQLENGETDEGTTIESYMVTKTLEPNLDKFCLWRYCVVGAIAQGNYSQQIQSYVDTKNPTDNTMSLQGTGSIFSPRYGLPLQGRKCYSKISNVDGGKLSVESITYYFEPRRF